MSLLVKGAHFEGVEKGGTVRHLFLSLAVT